MMRALLCYKRIKEVSRPKLGPWHPNPLQVICEFAIWDMIAVFRNNGMHQGGELTRQDNLFALMREGFHPYREKTDRLAKLRSAPP